MCIVQSRREYFCVQIQATQLIVAGGACGCMYAYGCRCGPVYSHIHMHSHTHVHAHRYTHSCIQITTFFLHSRGRDAGSMPLIPVYLPHYTHNLNACTWAHTHMNHTDTCTHGSTQHTHTLARTLTDTHTHFVMTSCSLFLWKSCWLMFTPCPLHNLCDPW